MNTGSNVLMEVWVSGLNQQSKTADPKGSVSSHLTTSYQLLE